MDKHRDQKGVWAVRYSGFMDNVIDGVGSEKCPNQGRQGLLCQKRKVAKGDNKKLCKCWKKGLYNYQKNKK
jgi:hypothetical protein